mmetsp:Transcript_99085/g.178940  ORF Transcript_99085/g.178940 Transcript_99085/m.178940 type:complete len:210 (-) Transcript_99085:310-939(-)
MLPGAASQSGCNAPRREVWIFVRNENQAALVRLRAQGLLQGGQGELPQASGAWARTPLPVAVPGIARAPVRSHADQPLVAFWLLSQRLAHPLPGCPQEALHQGVAEDLVAMPLSCFQRLGVGLQAGLQDLLRLLQIALCGAGQGGPQEALRQVFRRGHGQGFGLHCVLLQQQPALLHREVLLQESLVHHPSPPRPLQETCAGQAARPAE